MTPSLSEGGAQRTRVAIFIHSCILLIRNLAPRPEVYSVYTQSYTEQAVARAHVTRRVPGLLLFMFIKGPNPIHLLGN